MPPKPIHAAPGALDRITPTRRTVSAGLAAGIFAALLPERPGAATLAPHLTPTQGIRGDFASVTDLARRLSREEHRDQRADFGGLFSGLDYDAYRAIRPHTLPLTDKRSALAIDPMPPGHIFTVPVRISLVDADRTMDLAFDPALFRFDPDYFDPAAVERARAEGTNGADAFSGFRLRSPINRPDVLDEVAVFQGASYFRAVARGLNYGLSARGLAIDTAEPQGEEFPSFTHFWIDRPEPGARELALRALLESPSCTGAYAFEIAPGETTVMQVSARLFPRRALDRPGLAPLTSMYFFGPERRAEVDDFRDAVHDSSGLQMVTGAGQRVWRALTNPAALQISAFSDSDVQGFGLTQRPRSFDHYQDAEARYDRRPSCWIEPLDAWGDGAVVLVEIPVDSEFHDNIVAFWRPASPLAPSDTGHEFRYRLHWGALALDTAPLGRVQATRAGATIDGSGRRSLVVDFRKEGPWASDLRIDARRNGEPVEDVTLKPLPGDAGRRVALVFDPGGEALHEFRLTLMGPDGPETETWLYRWTSR